MQQKVWSGAGRTEEREITPKSNRKPLQHMLSGKSTSKLERCNEKMKKKRQKEKDSTLKKMRKKGLQQNEQSDGRGKRRRE